MSWSMLRLVVSCGLGDREWTTEPVRKTEHTKLRGLTSDQDLESAGLPKGAPDRAVCNKFVCLRLIDKGKQSLGESSVAPLLWQSPNSERSKPR